MLAEVLSWTIYLPTLVLIAQGVFLLARTNRQTDATERPTPTPATIQPAWVTMHVDVRRLTRRRPQTPHRTVRALRRQSTAIKREWQLRGGPSNPAVCGGYRRVGGMLFAPFLRPRSRYRWIHQTVCESPSTVTSMHMVGTHFPSRWG